MFHRFNKIGKCSTSEFIRAFIKFGKKLKINYQYFLEYLLQTVEIRTPETSSVSRIGLNTKHCTFQTQWESEIWTSLDFEWSLRGWVANGPDLGFGI